MGQHFEAFLNENFYSTINVFQNAVPVVLVPSLLLCCQDWYLRLDIAADRGPLWALALPNMDTHYTWTAVTPLPYLTIKFI